LRQIHSMQAKDPHIQFLLDNLILEEKAQVERFSVKDAGGIKSLKRDGLALHPIKITRKSYGFAEYPEFSFKIPQSQQTDNFRDGTAIELFFENETSIKGILLGINGGSGEARIFAPDFPDWIEDHGVGIKLTPDTKTQEIITSVLQSLDNGKSADAFPFFTYVHQNNADYLPEPRKYAVEINEKLNESQQEALSKINGNEPIVIVHGPPGTGKTTTLVASIAELVKNGEKVLVCAPSNAATDHIALQLIKQGISTLRIGNQTKMSPELLPFTLEGKMALGNEQKQIKKMRIQAEEYRKMSHQYKRHFGKDDRDQRKLLIQEVKNIRKEIRALQDFYAEKWISETKVICGTPVGLNDKSLQKMEFNTLVIDEAGQCLESLAWVAIKNVQRLVLAGDHLQLPPTVISEQAMKNGYNKSFLEVMLEKHPQKYLLRTQYRMRQAIVDFPNNYFYEGKLETPPFLQNTGIHFQYFDTAGTGFQEEQASESGSLSNVGELEIIEKIMEQNQFNLDHCALITPYSGQVALAKERFPKNLRISTVDSFQGQECEIVFISLVRSNDECNLGFLKDYRRMNVAMTRAKTQLIVVGDSVTFGNDPFFGAFLLHSECVGSYGSAWEFMG
jgi:ATP-dependent RNA/DNA helicase IGHMBP2